VHVPDVESDALDALRVEMKRLTGELPEPGGVRYTLLHASGLALC